MLLLLIGGANPQESGAVAAKAAASRREDLIILQLAGAVPIYLWYQSNNSHGSRLLEMIFFFKDTKQLFSWWAKLPVKRVGDWRSPDIQNFLKNHRVHAARQQPSQVS